MTGNRCVEDINLLMDHDTLTLEREEGFLVLSSSPYFNGFGRFKSVVSHSLGQNVNFNELSQTQYLDDLILKKEIKSPAAVIFNHSHVKKNKMVTIKPVSGIVNADYSPTGDVPLISIMVVVDQNLDQGTLLKLMIRTAEARKSVLLERGVSKESLLTKESILITCTGHTHPENIKNSKDIEELTYDCVDKSIKLALKGFNSSKTITEFLSHAGVEIDELVEAGAQLLAGVEDSPELRIRIKNQLEKSLKDINVISLIMAGIRVEEDYQNHRVKEVNVDDDPAYLYADEVLGMAIANQIAGTKALFNFKRYDEEKPGILSSLGPMMDDVCAGLIAGSMSKIFEE